MAPSRFRRGTAETQWRAWRGERLKHWAERLLHSYLRTDYFVDMRGIRGLAAPAAGLWPNSKRVHVQRLGCGAERQNASPCIKLL
jgi:hypothetical protein